MTSIVQKAKIIAFIEIPGIARATMTITRHSHGADDTRPGRANTSEGAKGRVQDANNLAMRVIECAAEVYTTARGRVMQSIHHRSLKRTVLTAAAAAAAAAASGLPSAFSATTKAREATPPQPACAPAAHEPF